MSLVIDCANEMTWLNTATPWLMKEMRRRNSVWKIKNSERNLHETSAILESNMTEMKKKIHNFKSQYNQAEQRNAVF